MGAMAVTRVASTVNYTCDVPFVPRGSKDGEVVKAGRVPYQRTPEAGPTIPFPDTEGERRCAIWGPGAGGRGPFTVDSF